MGSPISIEFMLAHIFSMSRVKLLPTHQVSRNVIAHPFHRTGKVMLGQFSTCWSLLQRIRATGLKKASKTLTRLLKSLQGVATPDFCIYARSLKCGQEIALYPILEPEKASKVGQFFTCSGAAPSDSSLQASQKASNSLTRLFKNL